MDDDQTPVTRRTRAAHAGKRPVAGARSLVTPIYQSAVYAVDDAADSNARHRAGLPNYSRDRFPNVRQFEQAVADLEGADAGCATASGMAAISLVFLTFLSAGDHVVLARGYCDTEDLLDQLMHRFGVACSGVDVADPAAVEHAIRPETRLMFVETIANPSLHVPDLDALATICERHDVLLVVDNTFATPLLCRPLEHGADLVVHSATKFLGGHHDLTAGVVVGSAENVEQLQRTSYLLGVLPGAVDAWLAVRGIQTLLPRMEWITLGAESIARALARHPAVQEVRYPGLAAGEAAAVVARMLPDGCGGMLAFRLSGDAMAEAMVRRLRLVAYAPSLGGVETTICFPPRPLAAQGPVRQADGWLRLSVGLESPEDVIGDLTHALEAAVSEDGNV